MTATSSMSIASFSPKLKNTLCRFYDLTILRFYDLFLHPSCSTLLRKRRLCCPITCSTLLRKCRLCRPITSFILHPSSFILHLRDYPDGLHCFPHVMHLQDVGSALQGQCVQYRGAVEGFVGSAFQQSVDHAFPRYTHQ